MATWEDMDADGVGEVGDDTDFEIETAPWIEEPMWVKGLLREMRKDHEAYEHETFMQAQLNERFVAGRQTLQIEAGEVFDLDEYGVEYPTRNLLRNLVLTWGARILEDRPSVKAWPSDASLHDAGVTEIANKIIAYQYVRQDIDAMMSRAAKLAQMHSCVAFKTAWDPEAGATGVDEMGQPQRMGEISIDVATVFDYITDGSEHVKDSAYCAFRRFVGVDDAKGLLWAEFEDVNLEPQTDKVSSLWNSEEEKVEIWEIWHKPTARIPKGLYAVVVGGHVTESREYPYDHGELPIAVWKIGSKRDHPHGDTHVSDARHIQQIVNELLFLRKKIHRAYGQSVKLVGPADIVDDIDSDNQVIAVESPDWKGAVGYIEPPSKSLGDLYDQVSQEMEAMAHVFGLNEAIYGAENAKSTSGRAIAYLKELDSQKLSEASRNLGEVLRRIFRQVLRLTQQYVEVPRLIGVAGEENAIETVSFMGADIEGVDIILEPMSGSERYRAANVGVMEERMAAGFEDPARVAQLRDSGLDETGDEQFQRQIVEQQIDEVINGGMPQPDPQVNPKLAAEEIMTAASDLPEHQPALLQFLQAYKQIAAQAQQAQPQAQPGPQGGPPKPPGAKPQLLKQKPPTSPAGLPKPPQGGF